jgi:hypothetical protein
MVGWKSGTERIHVLADLQNFLIQKLSTFGWLCEHISNIEHVSSHPVQLVVELAESNDIEFQARREKLAGHLEKYLSDMSAVYRICQR